MNNPEMEIYYAVVNLIDWYVAQQKDRDSVEQILKTIESVTGISPAEVGEANDCGLCATWGEVIDGFVELTEAGERVPV